MLYDREGKRYESSVALFMATAGTRPCWKTPACAVPCDCGYRRVAWDEHGVARVSTAWLRLDHNHAGPGPRDRNRASRRPLIFETMVFLVSEEGYVFARDSTEAEAVASHYAACRSVGMHGATLEALRRRLVKEYPAVEIRADGNAGSMSLVPDGGRLVISGGESQREQARERTRANVRRRPPRRI